MTLSIITINFNNVNGLQKTIDSVVNQTFKNIEFIVIDGGSTDSSVSVIEKYKSKINYWVSEKDSGIFDAQNKGIVKATGNYIQVLNSGDELASSTILQEIFENNNYDADILYGNMIIAKNGILKNGFMPNKITLKHLIDDTIWHPTSFIKSSFFNNVGLYNTNYKIAADYEWFLRAVLKNNATTKYINKFIAIFYEDGASSNPDNLKQIISEKNRAQQHNFNFLNKCFKQLYKITDFINKVFNKLFKVKLFK